MNRSLRRIFCRPHKYLRSPKNFLLSVRESVGLR